MSEGARRRVHAWVEGVVQGVSYRAATQRKAQALDLAGWVRNLPDGRVEVVLEGPGRAVEALMAWLSVGPPTARVDRVLHGEEPPTGEAGAFVVRPTPR